MQLLEPTSELSSLTLQPAGAGSVAGLLPYLS